MGKKNVRWRCPADSSRLSRSSRTVVFGSGRNSAKALTNGLELRLLSISSVRKKVNLSRSKIEAP